MPQLPLTDLSRLRDILVELNRSTKLLEGALDPSLSATDYYTCLRKAHNGVGAVVWMMRDVVAWAEAREPSLADAWNQQDDEPKK